MNSYVNIKMFSFPFGSDYDCRVFSYIISMALTLFSGMTYARKIRNILFLSTKSKAFLTSMKIMADFLWFHISSMICLRARIWDDVDHRD